MRTIAQRFFQKKTAKELNAITEILHTLINNNPVNSFKQKLIAAITDNPVLIWKTAVSQLIFPHIGQAHHHSVIKTNQPAICVKTAIDMNCLTNISPLNGIRRCLPTNFKILIIRSTAKPFCISGIMNIRRYRSAATSCSTTGATTASSSKDVSVTSTSFTNVSSDSSKALSGSA